MFGLGTLTGALGQDAGRILRSGLAGAAIGGTAGALYKGASGEDVNVGDWATGGALLMGGYRMLGRANKAGGLKELYKGIKPDKIDETTKMGGWMAKQLNNKWDVGINNWLKNSNGKTANWINRNGWGNSLSGFVKASKPGLIAGAVAGAGYGAMSDSDSMVSGAFKGALIGAAISGSMYKNYGGTSKLTKATNKITGLGGGKGSNINLGSAVKVPKRAKGSIIGQPISRKIVPKVTAPVQRSRPNVFSDVNNVPLSINRDGAKPNRFHADNYVPISAKVKKQWHGDSADDIIDYKLQKVKTKQQVKKTPTADNLNISKFNDEISRPNGVVIPNIKLVDPAEMSNTFKPVTASRRLNF